jgi:flagellin-like hook-associated protein FlgL
MTLIDNRFYPLQSNLRQITAMRGRFDALQVQLASGERAGSLAELGGDRFFDLTIRARASRIEGYQANLTALNLRVDMLDTTLGRLGKLQSEARGIMSVSGYGQGDVNLGTAPKQAEARLDELLNLLNAEIGSRYLFGGNSTDSRPVASLASVLDGEGGRDGFRTVLGERRQADLGASGLGRLVPASSGTTVTLAEDGAHPFGFKLGVVSGSGTGITVGQPAGSPAALSLDVTGQPQAGDRITIGLRLPDGTETALTLTAGGTGDGGFAIGADTAETAANIETALRDGLAALGRSTLTAASAFAAADNFFNGQGEPVKRVSGTPPETASALIDAPPGTTVAWYRGQDSSDPRATASVRIDDGVSVKYGVQANEAGLAELVRSLAVMATAQYTPGEAASRQRFDAVASRQLDRLGAQNGEGSIQAITVEIGLARARAESTAEHHADYADRLETLRSGIEGISTEEVAMEILALKTRLEASYQTAALVSQLNLVNYLK